jgi:hypothetical protein
LQRLSPRRNGFEGIWIYRTGDLVSMRVSRHCSILLHPPMKHEHFASITDLVAVGELVLVGKQQRKVRLRRFAGVALHGAVGMKPNERQERFPCEMVVAGCGAQGPTFCSPAVASVAVLSAPF